MLGSLKRTHRRELTLRPSCIEELGPKIKISTNISLRSRPLRKKAGQVRPSIRAIFGIDLLPPEILAHVFVLGSLDDIMLPFNVSHTCSSWRNVALHTPELWRRIHLDGRDAMWKERIRRAKACTLDVYLIPSSHAKPLDDNAVQKHMHVILPHLHRLRSLVVSYPSGERAPYLWNAALSPLCPTLSPRSRFAVPRLSSLVLNHPDNDDGKVFTLFAGSAPRLRHLTLAGIRLDWLPSLFGNLSYLNYTHHAFTHGFKAVREVLSMLSVSSQLVQLRIRIPPTSDRRSWPPAQTSHSRLEGVMIQLPKLESLTLAANFSNPQMEIECYTYLVWHLALPSIKLLCLEGSGNPAPRSTPANLRTLFTDYTARLHQFWGADSFRGLRSLRVVRCGDGWYGDGRPVLSFIATGILQKLRRVEGQRRDKNGVMNEVVHRFR